MIIILKKGASLMTSNFYDLINFQTQLQTMLEPAILAHNQLNTILETIPAAPPHVYTTLQTTKYLQDIYSPIQKSLSHVKQIMSPLHSIQSQLQSAISIQQNILNVFSSFPDNILPYSRYINSSIEFSDILTFLISETAKINLSPELDSSINTIDEIIIQKKSLTWKEMLDIITFIIVLITFIQSQFPAMQPEKLLLPFIKLTEIESKELDLLEQLVESESRQTELLEQLVNIESQKVISNK